MATIERPQLDAKESRASHVEDSKVPAAAPVESGTQDLAATFYADYAGQLRDISPEENKRVLWKIDRYLMPMCVGQRGKDTYADTRRQHLLHLLLPAA